MFGIDGQYVVSECVLEPVFSVGYSCLYFESGPQPHVLCPRVFSFVFAEDCHCWRGFAILCVVDVFAPFVCDAQCGVWFRACVWVHLSGAVYGVR